jgi:hypothetical protein
MVEQDGNPRRSVGESPPVSRLVFFQQAEKLLLRVGSCPDDDFFHRRDVYFILYNSQDAGWQKQSDSHFVLLEKKFLICCLYEKESGFLGSSSSLKTGTDEFIVKLMIAHSTQ